jgi:hypothetical protein
VTGHFGSLVPGDQPQQRRRQVRPTRPQCFVQGVSVALRKMQQSDHPGLPFDERADRLALVLADDEIAPPVPRLGAVLGWEGRWWIVSIGCSNLARRRSVRYERVGDHARCAAGNDGAEPAEMAAAVPIPADRRAW